MPLKLDEGAALIASKDNPGWAGRAGQVAPLAVVLLAFAGAALVIPTMAQVALTDDWIYTRSVEILVRQHHFQVLDQAAPLVGFQVLWGAIFAWVFGLSLGTVRLSTVVMSALGGVAVYGVCRELAASRARSALGSAIFLFNPLSLALTYSFMTDAHYVALMAIASFGYVRGLGRGIVRWTIFGSVAGAMALLVRQQGILLPLGAVAWLLLARRRPARRLAVDIAIVLGGPLVLGGAYYRLLYTPGGAVGAQSRMAGEVAQAGLGGISTLVAELAYIGLMYAAVFAAPLVISSAFAVLLRVPGWGWRQVAAIGAGLLGLTAGLLDFADQHMPYVQQFVGSYGLGSNDLAVGRHELVRPHTLVLVTWACALLALGLVALLVGALRASRERRPNPAGIGAPLPETAVSLVVALAVSQFFAAVPASMSFRNWPPGTHAPSVDRYLLPLLPFTVWLTVWASSRLRASLVPALLVTALLAVVGIAGTRDNLAWQQQVWDMASSANRAGVRLDALDAGAAWDGYKIGEETLRNGIPVHTPGGAWWLYLFSPRVDSTYVIAMSPLPGYDVVTAHPYQHWLGRTPETMYLLRRGGAHGPL